MPVLLVNRIIPATTPDVTPPNTPSALAGAGQSETTLLWTWAQATDQPGGSQIEGVSGVAGYKLYDSSGSLIATIAGAAVTQYLESGLSGYTSYSRKLTAYDAAANESGFSSTVAASTLDTTGPTAPTITASELSETSISIALTAAATDALSGVSSYALEYLNVTAGDTSYSVYTSSLTAGSFPYTVIGLSAGTTYSFRARATDVSGNVGSYSAVSVATTTAASSSGLQTGLDWDGTAPGQRQMIFTTPPSPYDITVLWKVYQRDQVTTRADGTRYYTTFFYGNNGLFVWGGGYGNSYYGAHPYPTPAGAGDGKWELSQGTQDYRCRDTNSSCDPDASETDSPFVVNDAWYSQAMTVRDIGGGAIEYKFYIDLDNVSTSTTITVIDSGGFTTPPSPALMFGQAPDNGSGQSWGGYDGWEEQNAILRGLQVFTEALPQADIEALGALDYDADAADYCTTNAITSAWYRNMNPTPSDITDKSGAGHDPGWTGTERPTLYTSTLATWAERSTAAGVVMATRFDTQAEVDDWTLIDGLEDNVFWQNVASASGNGALCIEVLDVHANNSGNWRRYLADDQRIFGNGDTYYVQYRYRCSEPMWRFRPIDSLAFDAGTSEFAVGETVTGTSSGATGTIAAVTLLSGAWGSTAAGELALTSVSGTFTENEAITSASGAATVDIHNFPNVVLTNGGGNKISIFSDYTSSSVDNEVVTQNTQNRAFFQMYHQNGTDFPPLIESRSTPCNGSNYALQNAIDAGTPLSPSTCAEYANRYGPLYDYGTGVDAPSANDVASEGHPRSEAIAAGVEIPSDEWVTILTKVQIGTLGTASSAVDQWIARDGEDYVHVHSYTGLVLGTNNGGHDAIHLLPYETGKQAGAKGVNTRVYYDEVIVSTATIPAPVAAQAPNNTLAQLAATMSAGEWAQLTVSTQDAVLGVGGDSGSMTHFCNSMPWNPVSKVVEIIGMDHNYTALRHVRYDVSTNAYVLVADNSGLGQAHGYDHNAVNPYTGDLYHRLYSGFTGNISSRVKPYKATSFSSLPDIAASDQVAIGACWWSGSFTGCGAQGCFMIFNSGNAVNASTDGQILAYDPLSGSWFYDQSSKAPNYGAGGTETYHSLIEYSAVHNVVVYGGGNVAQTKLWKMDSSGTVTAMPATPGSTTVGIEQGLLVADPVTGNFLLLSAGELWELDPTGSGTWTQATSPPSGVGDPQVAGGSGSIMAAIPEYGVIMVITQTSGTGGTTYLYKHA